MSYFKNIFICLYFDCMKYKIHNENKSFSLSDGNQIHDNKKIEQSELLLIYNYIKSCLEFINYILDVKFSRLVWSCTTNPYFIIEPLTDNEHVMLLRKINYINNNYKYINKNIYNNNLLIDLYNEITNHEYSFMNVQKINTLDIILKNYKNIHKYINNHISLIEILI